MSNKVLQLKKGADRRLKQGHLWVYSNEVDASNGGLKQFQPGEQAGVVSHSGKPLGTALVNPNALICGRLISRSASQLMDKSLIVHRLKIALSLRQQAFEKPFYRLVFGDSDGLPGLVVDRFGDTCVAQISSYGMELLKSELIEAIEKVIKPTTLIFRNDGKMREVEGLESYTETVFGEETESVQLEENGVLFSAPVLKGQKTGWFYDHRMSRARLAPYVKGKRVLDVFSYVGGWGVQAAAFGAESVTCVDASEYALDYVDENAKLNGVSEKVSCIQGDAFAACRELRDMREKFDVVIIDPPAFIPRRRDIKAGEQAYQRINQLAMRLLEKDGVLVSASCSMHLQRERLTEIIRATGRQTDRFVQIIEQGHQGADHPIIPAIPETEYLKACFARVLPSF
ncbi:class I SAM-dependent rRNA methyltransferase [Alkalimarinus coralli]|uniref:class I SAM-dependent rRNA methyltransferase n=1 Tax=Alkalimarinus coralli TaxID=2935863 RepID=UPI00202ADBC0|nr:class I SAM-dependent rRNA methyltransferase [Alkalimarinus coralli]